LKLKDLNMKKKILYYSFCSLRCRQFSQELKWHTNVKEAIAIGNKEHKPLMMFFYGIVDGASDYKRSVIDSEFAKGSR
jgi:hypothetical protein